MSGVGDMLLRRRLIMGHLMQIDPRLTTPLTFEITGPGKIKLTNLYFEQGESLSYKLNDGQWVNVNYGWSSEIDVVVGDVVMFVGNRDQWAFGEGGQDSLFSNSTCQFKVSGNIMSLIRSAGFAELTSFPENSQDNFYHLFESCAGLTDASELLLPATTLTPYCYRGLFHQCSGLTSAPALPATTLVEGCYERMFSGCSSLINAPVLPARRLVKSCYDYLFAGCELLSNITCYAEENFIDAYNAPLGTRVWVSGVAQNGTFTKPASATWPSFAYDGEGGGIPSGWTVVEV